MEKESDDFFDHENDEDYTPALRKTAKVVKSGKVSKVTTSSKKGKVVGEWTDDEVFKLIACVQVRPALWNAADSKYKNRIERTKLWNEISEMKFDSKYDGATLLAKWSNIRIQYRSYESKKTKSGQGAETPINWKFYTSMSFVGRAESEQTAETVSNLNMDDSLDSFSNYNFLMEKTPRTSRKTPSVCCVASNSTNSAASMIAESMKSVAQAYQQSKQQGADEFDTFGKYLASELRSLDNTPMARRIKMKINRFFLDAVEEEQRQQFQLGTTQ